MDVPSQKTMVSMPGVGSEFYNAPSSLVFEERSFVLLDKEERMSKIWCIVYLMLVLIHTKVGSWSLQGVSATEQQDNRAPGDIPTVPESPVSHHGTAVQLERHVICMRKKKLHTAFPV